MEVEIGKKVRKYTKWSHLFWRWHDRYYIIRDSTLYYDAMERFNLKSAKHHTFLGGCNYRLEHNGNKIVINNGAKEWKFIAAKNGDHDFIEFKDIIIEGISNGKQLLKERYPNLIIPGEVPKNIVSNINDNNNLIEAD